MLGIGLQRDVLAELADNERLDAQIDRACNALANRHGRTYVTGVGKSGLLARYLASMLASIGRGAHFLDAVDALHGDIGAVRPRDTIVAISASGQTEELKTLVSYAQDVRDVFVISIVGPALSWLDLVSNVTLVTDIAPDRDPRNLPTLSWIAAAAVCDELVLRLAQSVDDDRLLRNHPGGNLGQLRSA